MEKKKRILGYIESGLSDGATLRLDGRTPAITGDYPDTAAAIARELGLLDEGGQTMTGIELTNTSDDEPEDSRKLRYLKS